jgi:hypothetical protein
VSLLDPVPQPTELKLPENWPAPKYNLVLGFEDSRLFGWDGQLWTLSTVRELTEEGWCEQVLSPLVAGRYDVSWCRILPKQRLHEKNWAPFVTGLGLRFMYRPGVLVDTAGEIVARHECRHDVGHFSGGSQIVDAGGTFLALVHESGMIPGRPTRFYAHRFVQYTFEGEVHGMSMPFVFFDRQIEFAAGLAYDPGYRRLVVSFGVRDCEAWTATMDLTQVLAMIEYCG